MNIYIIMTIGGMLGIVTHSIVSIRAINNRIDAVNFKQVFKEYWTNDLPSIFFSVFFFLLLLFVASEFVDLKAIDTTNNGEALSERLLHFRIASFIKTSSIIAGYFSDSIVYGFLGVTEKKLKKFLDNQTPQS